MIEAYLQSLLDLVAASPVVRASNVTLDKRTPHVGMIRGDLYFAAVLQEIESIHPLIL